MEEGLFDGTRWERIEPHFRGLLQRPVESAAELERWLVARSEFDATCSEARALAYIASTCFTEDDAIQGEYRRYVEEVAPRLSEASFELDRRQASLLERFPLPPARYGVLERSTRADVEIFRAENVPLETELTLLAQKYDQIIGAMTVQFEGREQTLAQMGKYQESTDRGVREDAWRAVVERRGRDVDAIDAIYDEMISRRHRVARQAGFDGFAGHAFKRMHRFDYGVKECEEFQRGVEEHIVPLMRRLDEQRRRSLGLGSLRPWDMGVDVKGRPPLRPYEGGRELVSKTRAVFERLDPRLAGMFAELGDGGSARGPADGACLDLDSRKGKAPGGYQYMLDRSQRPFIFMNAAGLSKDVVILVHEAGHAFHSMLCRDEPLLAYRHSPIEFAEVASMSMELLTLPHMLGAVYDSAEDHARHVRQQVERSVTVLPWVATIDAFQHWIYANPTHARADRTAQWLALDERFGSRLDWGGLEGARSTAWQRQQHLFSVPFYYIEYGIAQLGALGLWLQAREKGERHAIDRYVAALSLGGGKPLPELFGAAGLAFEFGGDTLARVAERLERELERVDA